MEGVLALDLERLAAAGQDPHHVRGADEQVDQPRSLLEGQAHSCPAQQRAQADRPPSKGSVSSCSGTMRFSQML
jgi:hypothetical protein